MGDDPVAHKVAGVGGRREVDCEGLGRGRGRLDHGGREEGTGVEAHDDGLGQWQCVNERKQYGKQETS